MPPACYTRKARKMVGNLHPGLAEPRELIDALQ
jgi:hypothetical protein